MAPARGSKKGLRRFEFYDENALPLAFERAQLSSPNNMPLGHGPPNKHTSPMTTPSMPSIEPSSFPILPSGAQLADTTKNQSLSMSSLPACPAWDQHSRGGAVSAFPAHASWLVPSLLISEPSVSDFPPLPTPASHTASSKSAAPSYTTVKTPSSPQTIRFWATSAGAENKNKKGKWNVKISEDNVHTTVLKTSKLHQSQSATTADTTHGPESLPERPSWLASPSQTVLVAKTGPASLGAAPNHPLPQTDAQANNIAANDSTNTTAALPCKPPTFSTVPAASCTTASTTVINRPLRPKWKAITIADAVPSKFVWIEQLPAAVPTSPSDADSNEGWRGHPGLILGRWDGHVHLLGTTSWGGGGLVSKFNTANDPAAYHKWFFRLVGERGALLPGESEERVVRLRGEMAFIEHTRLDCRSVRRIPVARFEAECARYFRKRVGDSGKRRQVWIGRAEQEKLRAQLFRLGSLETSPWKVEDFQLLREWKEHMVKWGYQPPQEAMDKEEASSDARMSSVLDEAPTEPAGGSRPSTSCGSSLEKFEEILDQLAGAMEKIG